MLAGVFMKTIDQKPPFKNRIFTTAFLVLVICVLAFPAPVQADTTPALPPSLPEFIESVRDGSFSTVRGMYVQGVMAYAVDQQPSGNPGYVTSSADKVTQFKMAASMGNIGLLAHNYLAGASFSQIEPGDTIILVYGDRRTQGFLVQDIQQYQALSPLSPYSNFRDLETEVILTAEQLFNKVYRGDFHLTLQTCIEYEGDLSWGRLFIIATPIAEKSAKELSPRISMEMALK
jgi:hypothetical protein